MKFAKIKKVAAVMTCSVSMVLFNNIVFAQNSQTYTVKRPHFNFKSVNENNSRIVELLGWGFENTADVCDLTSSVDNNNNVNINFNFKVKRCEHGEASSLFYSSFETSFEKANLIATIAFHESKSNEPEGQILHQCKLNVQELNDNERALTATITLTPEEFANLKNLNSANEKVKNNDLVIDVYKNEAKIPNLLGEFEIKGDDPNFA